MLKVNGTGFQQCAAPAGTEALASGNDVITIATPGRKWYICGVSAHCVAGNQKLFITVLPAQVSSPTSSPSLTPSLESTATRSTTAATFGWIAGTVGLIGMSVAW